MSKTETMSEFYTIRDLARMLQCSRRTIRRMKADGQLPDCVRVRGMVRWRCERVREWLDRGCPDRSSEPKDRSR